MIEKKRGKEEEEGAIWVSSAHSDSPMHLQILQYSTNIVNCSLAPVSLLEGVAEALGFAGEVTYLFCGSRAQVESGS